MNFIFVKDGIHEKHIVSMPLDWSGICKSRGYFYVVGLISLLYNLTGSAFYLSLLPFITTIFRFISSLLAPLSSTGFL